MGVKVLVTGGAGCIGSDLVEVLIERGRDVVVFDNLSSGKIEHVANFRDNPALRFVEGDLLDFEALVQAMDGVEEVYHLAANPDVKYVEGDCTDKDLRQNTLATYNVLEAMRRLHIRRLIFSSTSAVYGNSEILPIPETLPMPRPISLYGATKLSSEAMISAFQHLFGLQGWIFRFANIVGAKSRKKGRTVISDFIAKLREDPTSLLILGNGKQAKSYLLSSECVEAMLFVVEHAREPLNIYNLGCDDWLTVNRIAEMVVQQMGLNGVRFEYTGTEGGWPGDIPRFRLDVSRLNRLGWKAKHSSEEAVSIAISENLRPSFASRP
jgi:UDP-glucose 4-epimerase